MTHRTLPHLVGLSLAAAVILGGCGDEKALKLEIPTTARSAIDVSGTVAGLVEAGATRQQAACIVKGVEAQFGDRPDVIDALTDESPQLAPDDQQAITGIIGECVG